MGFLSLFLRKLCVTLLPQQFRVVVFHDDPPLEFLSFDVLKLLGLDDVAEISSVTITLKLTEQVQLVGLQLFDSGIQAADTLEHLIVLGLVALYVLASLVEFKLVVFNLGTGVVVSLIGLIQFLLHVASGSDGLNI